MGAFDNTRPPVAIGAVGVARRAMDEVIYIIIIYYHYYHNFDKIIYIILIGFKIC